MIWLILLFTITTCEDVNLVKNTDPFTKVTTVRGTAPSINVAPFENDTPESVSLRDGTRLELKINHPDFKLHLSRNNDNVSIVIEQAMLHEKVPKGIGVNLLKPILGADSKLQLVLENGEVISIRYTERRIEARDTFLGASYQPHLFERRMVRISGHFRLSQNHITLLKNNRVKLLRVEFQNSTTDRQFNSDNEDYFINYLKCLEL